MSINPLYIPLFTIEEVILDKDSGLPLSGGVVQFYRDSQRATPKAIYQISGVSPNYTFVSVGNELTLGIAGDFVDTNGDPFVPYAFPYDAEGNVDLYYVTVESSGLVPQFVRQAVPYIGSGGIPAEERTNTENELTNPQFVEVLFPTSGATILNVTGSNIVTPIAPGWDLVSSGTGTITVERLEPIAQSVPTNPPYALRINADAALGASITLRQRLNNSPSLLRGEYVSATLTAAIISGGSTAFSLNYAPSTGVTPTSLIPSTTISTDGAYHTLAGNALTSDQANDPASTGYIDINIVIPTARNIAITSIQIVGIGDSVDIPFDQQSADRQKDHLFHYYENSLLKEPKENLLTGWIFALNPWQFTTTSPTNVANNTYTADQTIVIQQAYVTSAAGNNISVGRGTLSENHAFKVAAVTNTNKFALVQYIDPRTIRPYWASTLSVRANLALSSPTHNSVCRFKVRLIYRSSVPPTVAQDEPISSWTNTAGSDPVFKTGWTAIAPLNDPIYTINTTANTSYDFNQFELPAADNAAVNDAMTLGIAIYMLDNMNQTSTADQVIFNKISLINNDFAADASTKTWDESFRECQFYYETSYPLNNIAGVAVTTSGQITSTAPVSYGSPNDTVGYKTFQVSYHSVKRTTVTPTFYSPASATVGFVQVGIKLPGTGFVAGSPQNIAISGWSPSGSSIQGINMVASNVGSPVAGIATNASHEAVINYHFVCDCRLGI